MEIKDLAIVTATLLGPVLAVQAQKAIERIRERRTRKTWIFHTLMATRAARVSAKHVQALNMIDLVFYGHRVLGVPRRNRSEQDVLDTWHEYLDHLGTKANDQNLDLWNVKGEELFINLLFAMATDVGYKFDRVQLKKGAYAPVAHGNLELEQGILRQLALRILSGQQALKMEVTNFPVDATARNAQVDIHKKTLETIEAPASLPTEIQDQ
jgi:kynureninase